MTDLFRKDVWLLQKKRRAVEKRMRKIFLSERKETKNKRKRMCKQAQHPDLVKFGCVLWHTNLCRLFNAKYYISIYIYIHT